MTRRLVSSFIGGVKNYFRRSRLIKHQSSTDNVMEHFTTVTEAMESLRQRGYTYEFAPEGNHLKANGEAMRVRSNEFNVDEFHRVEGTSDPGDEMTVFGITTSNGKKGIFVMAQGTYANEASSELMAKFSISDRADVNTEGAVQPINSMPESGK